MTVEDVSEPVRRRLVRPEEPEVLRVPRDHVSEEAAEDARRLAGVVAGLGHLDGVVAEVRQDEVAQQRTAVRMRVGAHPALAFWGERGELGYQRAALVEELLGPVAPQPVLEQRECARGSRGLGHGHLVRAPGALDRHPVDLLRARSSPSGCAGSIIGHGRARPLAAVTRRGLDPRDLVERLVERGREAARARAPGPRRRSRP